MLGLEDTRDCASVIFILLGTMGFSNLDDQMLRSLCQRHGKVFVSQEFTVDSELQCFQLSDLGSRGQVWVTTSTRHLRLPGIQCGPIHSVGNPRIDSCTHSAMQVRTVGAQRTPRFAGDLSAMSGDSEFKPAHSPRSADLLSRWSTLLGVALLTVQCL